MNHEEMDEKQLLREILKWIKFSGMKEVKSTLIEVLDTDAKKLVYQKSDGTKGTAKLAKLGGYRSTSAVANLWNTWLNLSLGESIPVRGGSRFKRSFDLEKLGIEVPEKVGKLTEEAPQPSAEGENFRKKHS
jgi:hypothetical protein